MNKNFPIMQWFPIYELQTGAVENRDNDDASEKAF